MARYPIQEHKNAGYGFIFEKGGIPMDDLTPMEPAEILEVPESQASAEAQDSGYYGTCASPKKRRHVGLIVFLCILLAAIAGTIAFLSRYQIQIERTDGGYSMRILLRHWRDTSSAAPTTDNAPATAPAEDSNATQPSLGLSSTPDASDAELSLQEIYQTVAPSVVSVTADAGRNTTSTGTGVIMDADGYIITSYHVVDSGGSITVLLYDDSVYAATLVAADDLSDLAVLKIEAHDLTPAVFGDSDSLQVGDTVVAIGDPLGTELRGTMTDGIISAINRNLDVNGTQMTLIQTNAALNSGNSGGPLINCYGQVIGINTAKISSYYTSSSVEGLGFAIPIATVKRIVDDLLTSGYVSGRAALDLTVADMDELQRVYLGLPKGVYITAISERSTAYDAGIRYGDIIVTLDGTSITSVSDYNAKLAELSPGDVVEIIIYRSGALWSATVTMEEQTG
jgi:serine protease Do